MYIPKKINGAPRKKYAKIQDIPPLTEQPRAININNGIPANKLRINAKRNQISCPDLIVILLKKKYNIPKKTIAPRKTKITFVILNTRA